jgi:glucosamine--fructose-6-phosphate aminotransferase (isomerizing)
MAEGDAMGLHDEIFEQPGVLRTWLDTQLGEARRIAAAIRQRDIDFVFLAARGTSDHAGVYAQYLWGSLNRLPVAFAAPSLFTLYGGWPRLRHALVVGVSQSGQSPDVVSVITEGRRQGAATLAITNAPDSPLARNAEFALDIHAGAEKAVAATKTYTAELTALAALSAAMTDDGDHIAALERVPEAMTRVLGLDREAQQIAERHRELKECVVLGRGYNYATAQEWALKLKELAYVFADPYSPADFRHGPIAVVARGFPVLAIAPSGAVLADVLALLRRLRSEFEADLFVISDNDEALSLGHSSLRLPAGIPEWLTPLVGIVPAQLYCYHLTRAKGYDTEAPRGLRKVTLTR